MLPEIKEWLGTGSINIFGLPFSGKDTHGKRLADMFDASILGGGDILRNSSIPPQVKELIDQGMLAPTEDYINIVLPYLSRPEFAGRPIILSSVGRWHGEEDGVIGAAKAADHPVKAVVYLHVEEAEALRRFELSQAKRDRDERADDNAKVMSTRFEEFRNKTLPVIEYYRELGILIEVDGNPPVDEVSQNILSKLHDMASASSS